MKEIEISTEYITLGQLLKWIGAAESGIHARKMISQGIVSVNGEPEVRRGRKLRCGDVIFVESDAFVLKSAKISDNSVLEE